MYKYYFVSILLVFTWVYANANSTSTGGNSLLHGSPAQIVMEARKKEKARKDAECHAEDMRDKRELGYLYHT